MRNRRFKSIGFLILFALCAVSLTECGSSTTSTTTVAQTRQESHNSATSKNAENTTAAPTTTPPQTTPIPQVIGTYSFANCGQFHNGFAWVIYNDNNEGKWYAVVDEDFKIIYRILTDYHPIVDCYDFMKDGYAFYQKPINSSNPWLHPECVIIDTVGNELYKTVNTEDTYWRIVDHVDGLFVLCKDLRSFSQNTSSYYTIDAHGNVVQPLGSYESYKTWKDSFSKDDEVEHFTPKLSYPDPITVTGIGYGSGGYYPVQLKGADGNSYFTIVDKNGIQQFEPIKYPGLTFYAFTGDTTVQQKLDERFVDGVFVYSEDGEWYVVFPDGTKKSISGLETSREFHGFDGTYLYLGNSNNSSRPQSVVNVLTGEVHDKIYLYDDSEKQQEGKQNTEATESKSYSSIKNFSIFGTWKNTGSYAYGQAQSGAIIVFDGSRCNFFSPSDTYAIYAEGDHYRLDCTSPLGDTVSFIVRIVDENHIDIFNGQNIVELTRIVQ